MNLLKKLCETPGISGCEERIQKVIKEELEKELGRYEIAVKKSFAMLFR